MRTRKDSIDLICSVAELSGLFEKRSSVEGFLDNVVNLVAGHMQSDVCSIYLYDSAADELVLRATRGLAASSVGSVRLRIGEGITGLAMQELRPIREANASASPFFKPVLGIGEEQYEAFLAVPIRRGLTRIGVITLQDARAGYFDGRDTKALRAIAGQLAATLENVELLLAIHAQRPGAADHERHTAAEETLQIISGIGASPGVAAGTLVFLGRPVSADASTRSATETMLDDTTVSSVSVTAGMPDESGSGASRSDGASAAPGSETDSTDEEPVTVFRAAVDRTVAQLNELQVSLEEELSDVATLIFSAHLLMLQDEEFTGAMEELVRGGMRPHDAVDAIVAKFTTIFSASRSSSVQEKVQDVQDLGHTLMQNIEGSTEDSGNYAGAIVITDRLFPSEVVRLRAQNAEGAVVLGSSGVTAHIAILARSLGLPLLFSGDDRLFGVPEGTPLILDADSGTLYVHPDTGTTEKYGRLRSVQPVEDDPDELPAHSVTPDYVEIRVLANINLLMDVKSALKYRAEGVGLYRSEFPFIVRNDFPPEEEQYGIYRKIIEAAGDTEVTLRTLDIGGDKLLRFLPDIREANPFLGQRGIRFSLANRDIFCDQLRAMLRAGAGADLRIMFPMVASVDEFVEARAILDEQIEELARDGVAHNTRPKVGAMIELPSAVESVGDLAGVADFLSIGTNDLTMYMLAVDRTNERVGKLYQSYHPGVLRAIKRVADGAGRKIDQLSICGDAAGDVHLIPFFLGIGIHKLSVEPKLIPKVREAVSVTSMSGAIAHAEELLRLPRLKDVRSFLGIEEAQ